MKLQKLWVKQNTFRFQRVNQGSYYVAEPEPHNRHLLHLFDGWLYSVSWWLIHCIHNLGEHTDYRKLKIHCWSVNCLKIVQPFTWPHSKVPMSQAFIWASNESCRGMRAWEWGRCVYSITSQSALSRVLFMVLCIYHLPRTQTPHGLGMRLSLHRLYAWNEYS